MARQTSTPVIERKRRLDGSVVEYECERIVIDPGKRAVLRYVIDRTRQLEGSDLVLRPGMVTIGHFWVDRPYTVYHWLEAQRSLAYYFSVATELAGRLPITRQAVIKHLAVLSGAGLVGKQRSGREVRYRLEAQRLAHATEWLAVVSARWQRRLERLRRHLEEGERHGETGS